MSKGNAGCSMRNKLQDIGLYRLDGTTLVDAELQAYDAGFSLLCDAIWELEQENFVHTARGYGLELRERICGGVRDFLAPSDRQAMLQSRTSVTADDYTEASLERALMAVGIRARVRGTPDRSTVYLNMLETFGTCYGKSQAEIQTAAAEFLPAHLNWQFDFGILSWGFIEAQNRTFAQMDAADFTWEQIDGYSEETAGRLA